MPVIADLQRQTTTIRAPIRLSSLKISGPALWTCLSLLTLGLLFTGLNCIKPLHVDDACYVLSAAHIAENPWAPYDSVIYWDYHFQPANHVLAPPVLLYWLAAARVTLGDDPVLWKLSLLPWHLMLVAALFVLFRRWCSPLALPLTWMTALSPALLPSTNLMLDVPALSLSLTAVALMLRSGDRESWTWAIMAGLTAGLAMQTKYTALVTPLVFLAYGFTFSRMRFAAVAALIAGMVFVGWEVCMMLGQGGSHFLLAAQQRDGDFWRRLTNLLSPTATLTAALSPGVLFLAVLAWKPRAGWLAVGIGLVVAGIALLGFVPASLQILWRHPVTGWPLIKLDNALYGALTVLWWCFVGLAVWQFWRRRQASGDSSPTCNQALFFLLLWLSLEFAGTVGLSPFPAARRVLPVVVVATMLVGHVVSGRGLSSRLIWTAAGAAMSLGVAVALLDIREARATEELAQTAAQIAERENPQGRTWFSGLWAFQFYAMRHGLAPMAAEQTELHAGDLLILTEQQMARIDFHAESAPLAKLEVVTLEDSVPWCTLVCYYCGCTPLQHHEGPRLRLIAYRVLADFVPQDYGILPAVH